MAQVITVPVTLTENVAETIEAGTIFDCVHTQAEAREAFITSSQSNQGFIHAISQSNGGFAWEVITQSVNTIQVPWEEVREQAVATINNERTISDIAEFASRIEGDESANSYVGHLAVAFMVWATFGDMDNVQILRYHNSRYRGWVIRPTVINTMDGRVRIARGETIPAVAIVTDKNDTTSFMAFDRFDNASFRNIASGYGQVIETISPVEPVENFVETFEAIARGFEQADYSFITR